MTETTATSSDTSRLYALLIGIDRYAYEGKAARGLYGDLEGAVRDVQAMATFLIGEREVPQEHIRSLTASTSERERTEISPTYDNITGALQELRSQARRGDRLLIHYSGHGGRIPALCPELKPSGLDEALVPIDVGDSGGRYLRDVELAFTLRRMLHDGLHVTFVLDCCHSGGALRQRRPGVRGAPRVDRQAPRLDSKLASQKELIMAWRTLASRSSGSSDERRFRQARMLSGWFPDPRGYVLMAACRYDQLAFEKHFEAAGKNGVMTWWLLEAARRLGSGATCLQISNRAIGNVQRDFKAQTLQLEGTTGRVFLGLEERSEPDAVNVLDIEHDIDVKLAVGQAHGVHEGTSFAIYAANPRASASQRAVVRICDLGDLTSWAEVVERMGEDKIQPGARAFLLAHGPSNFSHGVRLPATAERLSEELIRTISTHGRGLLHPTVGAEIATFEVLAEEALVVRYQGRTVPELGEAVQIGSTERLIEKLLHVASHCNLQELTNPVPSSHLASRITVKLYRLPADLDEERAKRVRLADLERCEPLADGATVEEGALLCLVLENTSSQDLEVAVLDFAVDWSVRQIHPNPEYSSRGILDKGSRKPLAMRAYLPENYRVGIDVLKVLGTIETTDFRWLQLPPIHRFEVERANRLRGPARTSLENLLHQAVGESAHCDSVHRAATGQEWTTARTSLKVVRT
jgi:hypothetical protein